MTAATTAWQQLADGNVRFVLDRPTHPRQGLDRRGESAGGQSPVAAVLGCSDSRVPVELAFDQGVGDVFVVRNAGQVASDSAVASLEYAVAALGVPLVVVLAHESCGAVRAAIDAAAPDADPLPPLIAAHVARIAPAVGAGGAATLAEVGEAHLQATVAGLLAASELIAAAVADGSVMVVGARYRLADGGIERRFAVGDAA